MSNVWQKAFNRIFWRNKDKGAPYTPLGESKLLPMDASIDEMDDRILTLNTTKADQSDLLTAFKSVSFNSATGVFTFTKFNDTTVTVDTDIEKIAINFDYDDDPTSAHYQNLIITLDDGTVKYVDMSALLTQYEFTDSTTIHFTVTNGVVSANVINGSIAYAHLTPELQAQINNAEYYSEESEAWAVGQKNGQDVPSTDPRYHNNSKYYAQQAEASLSNTVRSFNSRTGAVTPAKGDYTIDKISPLNGAAVGQVPVVVNTGTSQDPVYEFAMGRVSGGGIGTCSSKQPMTNAYLVVPNAGFSVATGCYLSVIFANNFYYDGFNDLRLAIGESVYDVQVNGASPVTGKNYVKAGDAGIFVYDGTYFQLIGTSGGGHVIVDQDGTSMTQEDAMQFADAFVSDDSLNGRTVVENVKKVASADYSSETEDGMYLIPDGEGAVIGPASDDKVEVTADGNKSYSTLLDELFAEIDADKINNNAVLFIGDLEFQKSYDTSNVYQFGSVGANGLNGVSIKSSASLYKAYDFATSSFNDYSNTACPNGTVITLYYGNKKATVDLQTTANRCWMSDGVTSVESEINKTQKFPKYSNSSTIVNDIALSSWQDVTATEDMFITVVLMSDVAASWTNVRISGMNILTYVWRGVISGSGQYITCNAYLKKGDVISVSGSTAIMTISVIACPLE